MRNFREKINFDATIDFLAKCRIDWFGLNWWVKKKSGGNVNVFLNGRKYVFCINKYIFENKNVGQYSLFK